MTNTRNPVADAIKGKLADRARAAKAKGGDPYLDTREIAQRCGIPTATTRRHLYKLLDCGEVEVFDGEGCGVGRAMLWQLAGASK